MNTKKVSPKISLLSIIVVSSLTLVAAFVIAKQVSYAANNPADPSITQMVGINTPAPMPPFLAGFQPETTHAALSSALSYYFISGNTFTPNGGSIPYSRQVTGCVNQMPLNIGFSAPVHIPQGSQMVSITLYSYDSIQSSTTSTAFFTASDGMGGGGTIVSASSLPNIIGYQHNDNTQNNPIIIDNQNYNYYIDWRKLGDTDSAFLSLCGVRVGYYPPLGTFFLPVISR